MRFSLAMIVFETFELMLCQMLSSQGKNAPSNPYPHYLVRLAASRKTSLANSYCSNSGLRSTTRYILTEMITEDLRNMYLLWNSDMTKGLESSWIILFKSHKTNLFGSAFIISSAGWYKSQILRRCRERQREREKKKERERETDRGVCVCVCVRVRLCVCVCVSAHLLQVFNVVKNFGFINPVFKPEEGIALSRSLSKIQGSSGKGRSQANVTTLCDTFQHIVLVVPMFDVCCLQMVCCQESMGLCPCGWAKNIQTQAAPVPGSGQALIFFSFSWLHSSQKILHT